MCHPNSIKLTVGPNFDKLIPRKNYGEERKRQRRIHGMVISAEDKLYFSLLGWDDEQEFILFIEVFLLLYISHLCVPINFISPQVYGVEPTESAVLRGGMPGNGGIDVYSL